MYNRPPRPSDYQLYKGSAGLQLSLQPGNPAEVNSRSGPMTITKPGCVFLTVAPSNGPQSYDWSQKIVFGLSYHEVAKIAHSLKTGTEAKLYHDPGKNKETEGQIKKTIHISRPPKANAMFLNVTMDKQGQKQKIPGIPIQADEALAMSTLLLQSMNRILGWSQ